MAEEDSSVEDEDDPTPGLCPDSDSETESDDEDEDLRKQEEDEIEDAEGPQVSEISSLAGGFIRPGTEKLTSLRPKRPLMTWEEINRKLEIKFGTGLALTIKPTDDDVNLVMDFQENTDDEDGKALATLWLEKFQVAMDAENVFRKSNRLHLKEIEKAKSPEIPTSKPRKLVLNALPPSKPMPFSTTDPKLATSIPLTTTAASSNRFEDPSVKAHWKEKFEAAFKNTYYKTEIRDNR